MRMLKSGIRTLGAAPQLGSGWSKEGRGTRKERGYGPEWDKRRLRILARDEGLCRCCLRSSRVSVAVQVDHVMCKAEARARGWTDEEIEADDNLQSICDPCHKAKTADESARAKQGWP